LLDVSLVGLVIVYLGPGGAITGFLLVIIPCALRPNRSLGIFALVAASMVFSTAAILHGQLSGGPGGGSFVSTSRVLLDLTLFIGVSVTLLAAFSDLFGRLAGIRNVLSRAGDGSIEPYAFAVRNDSLGMVEQSLNAMLEQIASTIEVVQRGAEEFAALGSSLAHTTSSALESSQRVASVTTGLAEELTDLQLSAEAGQSECEDAAHEAQSLHSRADENVGSVRELAETAELGRDRIVGTIESVLAIGTDINRTACIVEELSGLSRQIGSAALSIAKIARHTHVLALNAAIEAARAEEHGNEFAVVADQVRTLAGEAGRSARDVGDLVSEVNAGIAAAASALVASEEKVSSISQIAGEARSALNDIRSGSSAPTSFMMEATETSMSQVNRVRTFADRMSQFAETSARWSAEVHEASSVMSKQITLMCDLDRTSQYLADIADRVKHELARYSTTGPYTHVSSEMRD
jgi:methyl-accepting chemotaxis protein